MCLPSCIRRYRATVPPAHHARGVAQRACAYLRRAVRRPAAHQWCPRPRPGRVFSGRFCHFHDPGPVALGADGANPVATAAAVAQAVAGRAGFAAGIAAETQVVGFAVGPPIVVADVAATSFLGGLCHDSPPELGWHPRCRVHGWHPSARGGQEVLCLSRSGCVQQPERVWSLAKSLEPVKRRIWTVYILWSHTIRTTTNCGRDVPEACGRSRTWVSPRPSD